MRRERRTALRRWSAGSLIVGGVLMGSLGLVLLLGDFMAMGAEDEVPLTMWLVPLVLGATAVVAGIGLSPRSSPRPPAGGW